MPIGEENDWNILMGAITIWPLLHKFIVKGKIEKDEDYEYELQVSLERNCF